MKENQKNEQVSNNPSNSKSQTSQNGQSNSQKNSSGSSSEKKNMPLTAEKEIKEKGHEHDYKTPVASSNGKVGTQTEKSKMPAEKSQGSSQGNTKNEKSTI